MTDSPFYLASASPRRLELLRQIGIEPRVLPAGADESALGEERPEEHVARLAELKARTVARSGVALAHPGLVLGADTAVVLDGKALGKPRDDADALGMLLALNGRDHEVLTGVCLVHSGDGRCVAGVETTHVRFRACEERELREYVATGEPRDKAGAYGIQGRGVLLVRQIRGSWSNVVGLPLERMPEWLAALGHSATSFS